MSKCPLSSYPALRGEEPFGPPAEYAEWREREGLTRVALQSGQTAWVATRYDYFRRILEDPGISSDPENPGMPVVFPSHAARIPTRKSWRNMDDPEHSRMRRMIARKFNAPTVEAMRPAIERRVDELLDAMTDGRRSADLMEEFAYPLPLIITCDVLGVPYEDHRFFKEKVDAMFAPGSTPDSAMAAGRELSDYMFALMKTKEGQTGDDVLSVLVNEQLAKGALEPADVVNTAVLLLVGGLEAVASMIGGSVILLTERPEQLAELRDTEDPKFVANAIEQLLRYISVTENGINRTAVDDVEVDGTVIAKGEGVVLNAPAANRDPRVFSRPEELDIAHVDSTPHVAFGAGAHQCIGQTLARVELQIALPKLLKRLPGLALAIDRDDIPYRPNMQLFGVKSLPVTW